jgi:hypothetical protein
VAMNKKFSFAISFSLIDFPCISGEEMRVLSHLIIFAKKKKKKKTQRTMFICVDILIGFFLL